MTVYDDGDSVRLGNPSTDASSAAFTNEAGTPTDPTAVTLTIKRPVGTSLVYGWPSAGADGTLTRESAGRFYTDITFTIGGLWRWRLAGTGAVTAADEGTLMVKRSLVA